MKIKSTIVVHMDENPTENLSADPYPSVVNFLEPLPVFWDFIRISSVHLQFWII